jgi:hypothetical protein
VSPVDVADAVATRVVTGNRPAPLGPLEQAAALAALGPSSTVVVRRHLRSQLVVDDQVRLRTFDRTITLPLATAKSLRTLLDGEPVRVSELPDLEPVDAVDLVRRLVREGVLVVLADGAPDVPPAAG